MKIFLRIYDYFTQHRAVYWTILTVLIAVLCLACLRLHFNEDISDFLPLTDEQREQMDIYQRISQAERIVIIFEGGTTDQKLDAIDRFADLCQSDTLLANNLTTQIDIQQYLHIIHWVTTNIPYFLTEADYQRIDSLLAQPDAVETALRHTKQMLQLPLSGFMQQMLRDDPLSLFSPVIAQLQAFQPAVGGFSSVDGYMLTDDETMAFAFFETPYGATETKQNTQLVKQLNEICAAVMTDQPDQPNQPNQPNLNVRLLGAPVIAVENASRIKRDSVIAILLSLVLILLILFRSFRHDKRSLLLILLTITFGYLSGIAAMALFKGEVSLIVLGIGSIIIGIAVNYPLHVLFHQRYTTSTRQTLQEVLNPLILGNITTVAAFLTLLPLRAIALQDIGIFAASMLIGTILFSIVFLPLLMKEKGNANWELAVEENSVSSVENSVSSVVNGKGNTKHNILLLTLLALITVGFYFAGRDISFDANMSHINYMTKQQRADFQRFAALADETDQTYIYIVQDYQTSNFKQFQTISNNLKQFHSPLRWLPNEAEQQLRLNRWNTYWQSRREPLLQQLRRTAAKEGFTTDAFQSFKTTLQQTYTPQPFDYFQPLAEGMLRGYYLQDDGNIRLITRYRVPTEQVETISNHLKQIQTNSNNFSFFDIQTLNSSLARALSDNFDYIGLVCSIIVFFFLWLSFRSFKRAFVAFLPMAVSWVWILGIMNLLGMQFNIVNIILATFIFGQGDDYTIFVVEGIITEHETGKPMLPQFRRSIILSALIMFVGIGVLVIARHPAMHSLGAVTLIGMGVVVLLANILPPLLKKML